VLGNGEVGHYAGECKNRKNNKLIKAVGSLDCFEISKEEALDLILKKNKRIIKIIIEYEYKESDYEKTSHVMESSSISLGDLQRKEFTEDNENEDIKGDWILLVI